MFLLEAKKIKIDEHPKTQQKPTDTKRMVTVDTVKKSWKDIVLAKYNANDWLMQDRSGKHVINLKCLLCFHYAKDIDKLRGFKNEWIEGSTNHCSANVLDHTVSEQDKICFNKYAKDKGLDLT